MTDEEDVIYHDSIVAYYKLLVQADLKPDEIKLVKAAMGTDKLGTELPSCPP